MHSHIRGIVVLAVGRALQLLAALATIRLATTLMSPLEMGSINQVTSLIVLMSSAVVAPVCTYFGRGLLEWIGSREIKHNLFKLLIFIIFSSFLLAGVLSLAEYELDFIPTVSATWIFALTVLYLLAYSTHTVATSGLVILGHRVSFVVFGNVASWLGLGIAIALFAWLPIPEAWLLGIYSGFVFSSIAVFHFLRAVQERLLTDIRKTPSTFQFSTAATFMFAWPQAIVYALWWTQSQSYRFILDDVADLASVGLFFAAYTLCSVPMQAFESLFNEYYAPKLYGDIAGQAREGLAKAWNAYASAYVPAVILFGAFLAGAGPYLAKCLLGDKFQVAGYIVVWPAMTECMRAISSSISTMGIAKVDMRIVVPAVVIGAISAPFLVYLLAPENPLLGTGAALFVAGMLVLVAVVFITRRALPITWPIKRIGWALLLGLPMAIGGGVAAGPAGTNPSVLYSFTVLFFGAIYMIAAQYLVARSWLRVA